MRAVLRRTALVVSALVLLASALSSQQAVLTILSKDARRAVPITMLNAQEYVALDDLAALFQFTVHDEPAGMVSVISEERGDLARRVLAAARRS